MATGRIQLRFFPLMIAAAFVFASCTQSSTSSSSTLAGSCQSLSGNSCTDFASENSATAQSEQSSCAQGFATGDISVPAGTFSSSACASAGLLGSCADVAGDVQHFYGLGNPPYTISSAQSMCATSGGTFTAIGNGPGPIDGTWNVTNITCNGVAGNASIQAEYSGTASEQFTINNTVGSYSTTANGCTLTVPAGYSYSGTTLTMIIRGVISCSPANCISACGKVSTIGPDTYTFGESGSTLTWTSQGAADNTCTTATPAQGNPIEYTFTKQ